MVPMLSHTQDPSRGTDRLDVEAWAAARALDKKGPVARWLAPTAAAEHAPLHLVHAALILEISSVLGAQPSDVPVTQRAEALVNSDLDHLVRRAARMVRSVRRRALAFAAAQRSIALAC